MKVLNKLILILFVLLLSSSPVFAQQAQKQTVLDFNLHLKNNRVSIVSIDKRQGFLPDYLNQTQKGYILQLLDGGTKELFKVKFNFPTTIFSDDFSGKQASGSVQTITEADTAVTTPYLPDAKKAYISDPDGKVIASQNLNLESLTTYKEDQAKKPPTQKGLFAQILKFLRNLFQSIVNIIRNIF